ncbi:hypothetical protein D3C76_809550 [compost metagenome]
MGEQLVPWRVGERYVPIAQVVAVQIGVGGAHLPLIRQGLLEGQLQAAMPRLADVLRLVAFLPAAAGRTGNDGALDEIANVAVEQRGFRVAAVPGLASQAQLGVAGLFGLQVRIGQGTAHARRVAILDGRQA